MFKWNRVLVALIGVPLLIFIYTNKSFNGIPLLIFTNLIVGIGVSEFYKMIKNMNKNVEAELGIFISLLIVNMKYFSYNRAFRLANMMATKYDVSDLLILAVITILVLRVFKNQIEGTVDAVANTLAGIVYVGVLFSPIIDIYIYGLEHNPYILLIIQVLVWASDTFAGIVGVSIGRKFFKNGFTKISPKKSVEGALGSLILTGLVAALGAHFLMRETLVFGFIVGMFISFVAQIGDLVESLFKRESGVKDSGTILMGHGGILDRFDSMILVIPVVYLFVFKLIIK